MGKNCVLLCCLSLSYQLNFSCGAVMVRSFKEGSSQGTPRSAWTRPARRRRGMNFYATQVKNFVNLKTLGRLQFPHSPTTIRPRTCMMPS